MDLAHLRTWPSGGSELQLSAYDLLQSGRHVMRPADPSAPRLAKRMYPAAKGGDVLCLGARDGLECRDFSLAQAGQKSSRFPDRSSSGH